MKDILFTLCLLAMNNVSVPAQTITGAWYSNEPANQISFVFFPNGEVLIRKTMNNPRVATTDKGKYKIESENLTILFADKDSLKYKIKLLDRNCLQMMLFKKNGKYEKTINFKRVIDEEGE